jgi:hypothetical protein
MIEREERKKEGRKEGRQGGRKAGREGKFMEDFVKSVPLGSVVQSPWQ